MLLESIDNPADLRGLTYDQLDELAGEIRDHIVSDDQVVTRFRWTGETAIEAGPWPAGTKLVAWCVAHYELRDGRIARIEQHDCYEPAQTP